MAEVPATILALFDAAAARRPEGAAVLFPGERASYSQLQAASIVAARGLLAAGIGGGSLVGVLLAAGMRNVELLLGIWRLGGIPVPINPRFKASELRYVVEHSGMQLLLIEGSGRALADQAQVGCAVVDLDEDGGFSAAGETVPEEQVHRATADVRAQHDCLLLYTSGTTASPKGALHTHSSLVHEGRNVCEHLGLTSKDVFWSPLPMFHCGGFCTMMAAWYRASSFCHPGNFEAAIALDQLERERCTFAFPAFETIWLAVLDHPRYAEADLSALKVVVNVGVPERLRQMQERMPEIVQISSFGSTESCGFMCMGDVNDSLELRCSTSGRPLPGMEIRIVDPDTGAEQPTDTPGEALLRGVTRFSRYHRDDGYTTRVIDEQGWFHSGDLLRKDASGRVSFIGRLKDVLKVGGENVSAAEIENYLTTHPAVKIVQVVAAPDARLIEVPCAFVELVPGITASEQDLIDYCLGEMATFKVPRYVRVVQEWPVSGTKVQKFRLREQIERELRAAGITEAPRLSSAART
ncbi:MAG: class I adenylate-forming enzyme family protein [Solirubrobacteraceae bacterium]